MKKTLTALFLIIVAAALVLTACSPSEPVKTTGKTTGSETQETTGQAVTTEEKEILPDIPDDAKFEGVEFRVLVTGDNFADNMNVDFLVRDENKGELINDAVLERINQTEERFGITIKEIRSTSPSNDLDISTKSNTDSYDIAMSRLNDTAPLAQAGRLVDFNEIKYVDMSKPWWDPHIIEDLSMCGKTFFLTGDISINDEKSCVCIFINKTLAEEENLPNLYEKIDKNEWTYEALYTYCKDLKKDLNGDGKFNDQDRWGIVSNPNSSFLFLNSFDATLAAFDADHKPVITINQPRAIEALGKIAELYNSPGMLYADNVGGWSVANQMVVDGKVAMIPANIYKFSTYIAMEDEFGVLPIPKLDSDQKEYHHQVFTNACPVLCVPTTNQNLEMTGMIVEYLSYVGSKILTPAFYDNYLNGRVVRDAESEKSFDIIFSTKCYDLGFCYGWNTSTLVQTVVLANGNAASYVDQIFESAQAAADETYNAFLTKVG